MVFYFYGNDPRSVKSLSTYLNMCGMEWLLNFLLSNSVVSSVVVSTIISGILFAHFFIVKCIPTVYSFLVTSLTVEARNEREN